MNKLQTDWFERDDKNISAHFQPALLIDLLKSHNLSSHKLLRGTGVFYEDILTGHHAISSDQLLKIISNSRQLDNSDELSFRWGHSLWPGHYGSFSQLLNNSENLGQALKFLCQYKTSFSPLIIPKVFMDDQYCYVQWLDITGLGDNKQFMVETAMTALSSMTRWLSGERLPWRYGFSYEQPDHIEHYQVNFNSHLHFGLGLDVMMIDKAWLTKAWPKASTTALQVAQHALIHQQEQSKAISFIEANYKLMIQHIRHPLSLERSAEYFSMSPATYKRKLKKHEYSFQLLQDQARYHVCMYHLHILGWNNEQVANYLSFNDATNFRRAFKRWSGMTPSSSRMSFSL